MAKLLQHATTELKSIKDQQYKRAKAKKKKKAAQDSEFCHRFFGRALQRWDESKVVVDSGRP